MSYIQKIVGFFTVFCLLVFTQSCAKKRPFLCTCYSLQEHRAYDLDVKSRSEADVKCAQQESLNNWDSCYIMLHE